MALEVTQIDLLVLDMEGAEMAVLGHLDLQKFNVQVSNEAVAAVE